ncbi:hypothetical protein CYMTET_11663, partial [Cymbomonas tetramitiformis]
VLEVLLEAGGRPNTASKKGATPLLVAAGRGSRGAVRLLLAAHADPNLAAASGGRPSPRSALLPPLPCPRHVPARMVESAGRFRAVWGLRN